MEIPEWVEETVRNRKNLPDHYVLITKKGDEDPEFIGLPITFPRPLHARFVRAMIEYHEADEVLTVTQASSWVTPKGAMTPEEAAEFVNSVDLSQLPDTISCHLFSYEQRGVMEHAVRLIPEEGQEVEDIPIGWHFTSLTEDRGRYEGLFLPYPTSNNNYDDSFNAPD